MMTKNFKHRRYSWLRTAGVLPAAVALMMLFGFTRRAPEIIFTEPETAAEQQPEKTPEQETPQTYDMKGVHERPQFPGGMKEFIKWLIDEIGDLSKETMGKKSDVKMELRFIIMEDGSLGDIKVLNTPDKVLSDKVVNALKNSPEWIPGTVNGKPVRVAYIVPVTIRMDKPAGGTAPKNDTVAPQAGTAKPEPEVVEEKVDTAAETGTAKLSSGRIVSRNDNRTMLIVSELQDSTRNIKLNSGWKGAQPFVWLENEGREIESLDGIAAEQIESVSVMKNPSDYPQEILDAMGDREFNGVIILKLKETDKPMTVTVADRYVTSWSGAGVTMPNEEKKLRYIAIEKGSYSKDMVTVSANSSEDSIMIKGIARADQEPFIWVSGKNPRQLSDSDLKALDPETILSVSVLKERPYPKEVRKALKNKDVDGVIILEIKE